VDDGGIIIILLSLFYFYFIFLFLFYFIFLFPLPYSSFRIYKEEAMILFSVRIHGVIAWMIVQK
jgi:hypothetical protein